MDLIQYYRQQLLHSLDEYETGWEEVAPYPMGYRWDRKLRSNGEIFRITRDGDAFPQFSYSVVLPEHYKHRNLEDLLEPFQSKYEISMTYGRQYVILTASVHAEDLHETVLGFLFRARSEMVDLIDLSVLRSSVQEES